MAGFTVFFTVFSGCLNLAVKRGYVGAFLSTNYFIISLSAFGFCGVKVWGLATLTTLFFGDRDFFGDREFFLPSLKSSLKVPYAV